MNSVEDTGGREVILGPGESNLGEEHFQTKTTSRAKAPGRVFEQLRYSENCQGLGKAEEDVVRKMELGGLGDCFYGAC